MKKKRSRKEIIEHARWVAENDPNVKRLRELAEKGQAEIDARKAREAQQ